MLYGFQTDLLFKVQEKTQEEPKQPPEQKKNHETETHYINQSL
jgi:hypothetical protein